MKGTDRAILLVDTDEYGQEVTLYIIRDTAHGLTDLEGKLTASLLPSSADNPRQRLKEALIAVIEHL